MTSMEKEDAQDVKNEYRMKLIAITIFQRFTCPVPFWWELVKGVSQWHEVTEQEEVQGAAENVQPTALGM